MDEFTTNLKKYFKNKAFMLCLLFLMLIVGNIAVKHYMGCQSLHWKKGKAIITCSEYYPFPPHNNKPLFYRWDIEYEYKVDGTLFKGNRVSYNIIKNFFTMDSLAVARVCSQYKKGTEVTVFYSPSSPSYSTLENGSIWWTKILAILFFITLIILLILFTKINYIDPMIQREKKRGHICPYGYEFGETIREEKGKCKHCILMSECQDSFEGSHEIHHSTVVLRDDDEGVPDNEEVFSLSSFNFIEISDDDDEETEYIDLEIPEQPVERYLTGKTIDIYEPIEVRIDNSKSDILEFNIIDISSEIDALNVFVVNEKLAAIFSELAPKDVQLIETVIHAKDGKITTYKLLNILTVKDVIDHQHSVYKKDEDGVLEWEKLAIRYELFEKHTIIRDIEMKEYVFISKRLALKLAVKELDDLLLQTLDELTENILEDLEL